MSGFVYLWYDRKHKRYYVGSHWGSPDDRYICSSNWMKQACAKRQQDFKRRILAVVHSSRKDLLAEEQRWLNMIKPSEIRNGQRSRYYNLNIVAGHRWHTDPDKLKTIGQKISRANKGRRLRPDMADIGERISKSKQRLAALRFERTGTRLSEAQQNADHGSFNKGRKHTEEWKAANAEKMRARPQVEVTCPACGKTGQKMIMKRWHFEKCTV